jgi:hypothetical protein
LLSVPTGQTIRIKADNKPLEILAALAILTLSVKD